MACYHPLTAYRMDDGSISFVERGKVHHQLSLPCGQCVGCRLERSRQWAMRIMHESKLYKSNYFITLTYDDKNLPTDNSLHYRDFQLFFKRLRKAHKHGKLRFYMCGEYGEDFNRPHFHACIFNLHLDDLQPWQKSPSGSTLYRSKLLEKCWTNGFSSVGELTFESAAYCARYIMKKVNGDLSEEHYSVIDYATGEVKKRTPEFNKMSLKPGIGSAWYDRFKSDVFPSDSCIVNGRLVRPPKYYDRKYKRSNPDDFELISNARLEALNIEDSRDDRLAVREIVSKARLMLFNRSLK